MEKKNLLASGLKKSVLLCTLAVMGAHASDDAPVLFGKDDWLFTPYEFASRSDASDTEATISLISKTNKLFAAKGIALAFVIVPSKIRIHANHLPDNKPVDDYTAGKYAHAVTSLKNNGVNVVNLEQPFMESPHRSSDTPLYFRLDTHWSPSGAMLAAQTIKQTIDSTPGLSKALAAVPEAKYSMAWSPKKIFTRSRDLVLLLPPSAPNYGGEQMLAFKTTKTQPEKTSLLGESDSVGITVIGSSYTSKNTFYPDALRYVLQRDLLDISINVDQGPWVGMEAYLNDAAFKTNPPKLIIWEIPERELRSPPNYSARAARYVMDNAQWMSRITALLK